MFATATAASWEKSSVIGDRTFEYRWSEGTGYTNVDIYAIAPTEGDIVIPETLEGGPVVGFSRTSTGWLSVSGPDTTSVRLPKTLTRICDSAFKNCGSLTNINLECVNDFGYCAFQNCSNLEVTVHVKTNTLFGFSSKNGSRVFAGCKKIKNIIIDDGVTGFRGGRVGVGGLVGLFEDSGVESIEFPESMMTLGEWTFSRTPLREVVLPDAIMTDTTRYSAGYTEGWCVFWGCTNLKRVVIGGGNKSFPHAFEGCTSLKEVVFDTKGNMTNISDSAFSGCTSLSSIAVPEGVVSIGSTVFSGCSNLSDVSLPSTLEIIGSSCFSGCTKLEHIDIPNGVNRIGRDAFYNTDLSSVSIGDAVTRIEAETFYECRNLSNVELPDAITYIGNSAFRSTALTTMIIPKNVTDIDSWAFENCSGLTNVSIPQCATNIGGYAFSGCASLSSITIPDNVSNIGQYAFQNCSGLESVSIGRGVKRYGSYAFENCSKLRTAEIAGLDDWCRSTFYGEMASPAYYTRELICNGTPVTDVTLSGGVTNISAWAFSSITNLASISIPASVVSIGGSAFCGCSGLTNVLFEGNAPRLGVDAFKGVGADCVVKVHRSSSGWGVAIPGTWNRLKIAYFEGEETVDSDAELFLYHNWEYQGSNVQSRVVRWAFRPSLPSGWSVSDVSLQGKSRWRGEWEDLHFADIYLDPWDGMYLPTNSLCGAPTYCRAVATIEATIGGQKVSKTLVSKNILMETGPVDDGDARDLAIDIPYMIPALDIMEANAALTITNGQTAAFEYALYPYSFPQVVYGDTVVASIMGPDGNSDLIGFDQDGNGGYWTWTAPNLVGAYTLAYRSAASGDVLGSATITVVSSGLPQIAADATPADVEHAIGTAGLVDGAAVSAAIGGDAGTYAAFRTWAQNTPEGEASVIASRHAARSYLLAAESVIGREMTSNDVHVTTLEVCSGNGSGAASAEDRRPASLTFEVSIDGVNIGGGSIDPEMLKENLKKVLGVEGATTLTPSAFSPVGIEITFDTPVDGKARFTVTPPADAGSSFFMRVKVK